MKAIIIDDQRVRLEPENDADNALLRTWGGGLIVATKVGSGVEVNGADRRYTVTVRFAPKEAAAQIQSTDANHSEVNQWPYSGTL